MNKLDLTGQRYGKLVVLRPVGKNKFGGSMWLCRCDCGTEKAVSLNALRNGYTKSCGCLERENRKAFGTRSKRIHNGVGTRLYRVWMGMKTRCYNENDEHWKDYGSRGIKVCAEWEHSFENFREWAIAHGYSDELTIDRIDFNSDYCPDNCRWVTKADQQRNKRNNRYYTYHGEKKLLQGWADEFGVTRSMLQGRIRRGQDPQQVFDFYAKGGGRNSLTTQEPTTHIL